MTSVVDTPVAGSQAASTTRGDPKKKTCTISPTSSKFDSALSEHNIEYESSDDDATLELIGQVVPARSAGFRQKHGTGSISTNRDELEWQTDMSKCAKSNEALFQRTIMMSILDRHALNKILDYNCEVSWIASRFPCRKCKEGECQLPKPTPDLAVAFTSKSLLPETGWGPDFERLGLPKGHVFYEGLSQNATKRAFHFFSLEVKGKLGTLDNSVAERQNLNTAAQALHSIYLCMREAGELKAFFKDVRFFSAVATTEGFRLRIHRPFALLPEQRIKLEYAVGFKFDQVLAIKGDYTRSEATSIVYNVLFEYGVNKLHPILKRTIRKLLNRRIPDSLSPSRASTEEAESQPSSRKRRAEQQNTSFSSVGSSQRRRLNSSLSIVDSQE